MKINQVKLLTILLRHRKSAVASPTDSGQPPAFNFAISDIPELVELLDEADRILQSLEVDSLTSSAQMAAALSEADIMLRLAETEPTLSDAELIASLDAIDRMLRSIEVEPPPVHLPDVPFDVLPSDVLPASNESGQTSVTAIAPPPLHTRPAPPLQLTPLAAASPMASSLAQTEFLQMESPQPAIASSSEASSNPGSNTDCADPSAPELNWRSDTRSFGIPRQVGIAAGVTIAITAGAVGQVANRAPEYEGTFQLTVQAQQPAENAAIATPQIEDENQRISDTQLRILESPRLLEPVIEQLQADHPNINFHSFTDNLEITRKGNQQLEVRYRDTDAQRVQLVLDQLAQTYVEYNQDCQDSACQGLKFIDAQIPQVQQRVSKLRQQIQQFHQHHKLKNLESQVRLFSVRSTEVAKQGAELSGRLTEARQRYDELQMRMALQPDEAIAQTILDRDAQYQTLFKQFRELDRQVVVALSSYQAEDAALKTLIDQHQQVSIQLNQEMVQVLARYISNPASNLQDPVFQEPELLKLLQYSIGTVHQINLMEARQQTIGEAEKSIAERKQVLVTVLRQYADLRQQLQSDTQILQQYFDKRQVLQAQSKHQQVTWQLVAPPELITDRAGQPAPNHWYDLEKDLGSAAVFGVLLGVAIAVVTKEKESRSYRNLTIAQ